MDPTLRFINDKFAKKPTVAEANRRALYAGWNYGETTDAFHSSFKIEAAKLAPGKYKNMSPSYGLVTSAARYRAKCCLRN